jgi:hypothetical protein
MADTPVNATLLEALGNVTATADVDWFAAADQLHTVVTDVGACLSPANATCLVRCRTVSLQKKAVMLNHARTHARTQALVHAARRLAAAANDMGVAVRQLAEAERLLLLVTASQCQLERTAVQLQRCV